MKIVVCGNNGDAWWEVRDGAGRTVATSFKEYTRLSDARRGANRFEQKLWMFYQNVEDDGQGITVEVAN